MNPDTIANMLEPLRAPAPPGWWPPAPGWWLLGLVVLSLLIAALFWSGRFYRRGAPLRAARRELARIEAADLDNRERAAALSRLQRRLAIRIAGRGSCAGLTGATWAAFLNQLASGDEQYFDAGTAEIAYRETVSGDDFADVLEATQRWLGALARPQ